MTTTPTLDIVNHSTLVSTAELDVWLDAIRADLSGTLMPLWGIREATMTRTTRTSATAWPIVILDDADQAGALGYHALDPHGRPYGRIFARPTMTDGLSVSSVLDHEIKEALGDAGANLWADLPGDRSSIARELCDPVQGNLYLDAHGVEHSDFVLPAYFLPGAPGPYSYLDSIGHPNRPHLTTPFAVAHAGYRILRVEGGRITTPTGEGYPAHRLAHIGELGSRTYRRLHLHARRRRPITASVKADAAGEWRYSVDRGNGEKVDPSEGYTRRRDAVRAIKRNRPDVLVIKVYNRRARLVRTITLDAART